MTIAQQLDLTAALKMTPAERKIKFEGTTTNALASEPSRSGPPV